MPETTSLFDKIAKHYDSLNTFFSFGMDKLWRKKLAEQIRGSQFVLDIATGTGEVAIETVGKLDASVIGIDPSAQMLGIAKTKCGTLKYRDKIALVQGFAEDLPFRNGSFDAITIAFGIRNTVDPLRSLNEMNRVLKPGGKVAILEFTIPKNVIFAPVYLFYFKKFLPFIGSFFGSRTIGDSGLVRAFLTDCETTAISSIASMDPAIMAKGFPWRLFRRRSSQTAFSFTASTAR